MNDFCFDFREYYVKGDTLYYINEFSKIIELKVRTIYSNAIISQEKDAQCYIIGYCDKDRIFRSKEDAQNYLGGENG